MPKFEGQPLSLSAREALLQKYGQNKYFHSHRDRLEFLLHQRFDLSAGPEKAENLTIVDLGCGSPKSFDSDSKPESLEAWFPRACASFGARPIGIDLSSQDPADEKIYTHIQTNLVRTLSEEKGLSNLLDGLENQVDIVTSFGVFFTAPPSPTLALSLGFNPVGMDHSNPPPQLKQKILLLKKYLTEQASPLLKPGGVLQIDLDFWKKTDEGLKPILLLNEAVLRQ